MARSRARAVHTQMPADKVPSVGGAKGSITHNIHAPFSGFSHDCGGPGGLPVKFYESRGEGKPPADHAPGSTAPPRGRGMPAPGKRRF